MKLINLYRALEKYPVKSGSFTNPLNQDTLGVQFVNDDGIVFPPPISNPVSFMKFDLLAGPFYQLEVFGWTLVVTGEKIPRYKSIRFLVKDVSGKVFYSSPLALLVSIDTLKELEAEFGIKWYYVDAKAFPEIHYTEMPTLEKLINHERTENSSLQPN